MKIVTCEISPTCYSNEEGDRLVAWALPPDTGEVITVEGVALVFFEALAGFNGWDDESGRHVAAKSFEDLSFRYERDGGNASIWRVESGGDNDGVWSFYDYNTNTEAWWNPRTKRLGWRHREPDAWEREWTGRALHLAGLARFRRGEVARYRHLFDARERGRLAALSI